MKKYIEDEDMLAILCEHLNKIIDEAVTHGGDPGGPYYSNEEGIKNAINSFLIWTGLNEVVFLYNCSHTPELIIKNRIEGIDKK